MVAFVVLSYFCSPSFFIEKLRVRRLNPLRNNSFQTHLNEDFFFNQSVIIWTFLHFYFLDDRWTKMNRYSWVWSTICSLQLHLIKQDILILKLLSMLNAMRVDWSIILLGLWNWSRFVWISIISVSNKKPQASVVLYLKNINYIYIRVECILKQFFMQTFKKELRKIKIWIIEHIFYHYNLRFVTDKKIKKYL